MFFVLDTIRPLHLLSTGELIPLCQSVVFIPDLAQSCSETWKMGTSFWPHELPENLCIFTFDYELTNIEDLASLVRYEEIEQVARRLLRDLQRMKEARSGRPFEPIFVAHGFGGLISEMV